MSQPSSATAIGVRAKEIATPVCNSTRSVAVPATGGYQTWTTVTASVTPDQVREAFACGPDPKRHLDVARRFADAGFDHLVAMNAGPDPDGFMDFFARELAAPLRALTPGVRN